MASVAQDRDDMAEPLYSNQALKALDQVENDPLADALWNALCDAIDLITDHPGSAAARRIALRTVAGTAVWQVSVRTRADDWRILWHQTENDEVLIAFIGTQ